MNNKIEVVDFDTLQLEKERLLMLIGLQETELEKSGLYLKQNHKRLLWEFINPLSKDTTIGSMIQSAITPIIRTATGIDIQTNNKGGIVINETVKSALVVYAVQVVTKWIRRRKEKKQKRKESSKKEQYIIDSAS